MRLHPDWPWSGVRDPDSKTDDWIKLDYEALREGSTFVTFGEVVK